MGDAPKWVWDDELSPDQPIEITDGFVTLNWQDDVRTVELRHLKPNGRELIQDVTGDSKTVQSGLDDGLHRFQLRADGSEWGEVLEVENTYMDRRKVVWLLISGGVVVTAIVVAIAAGSASSKEDG